MTTFSFLLLGEPGAIMDGWRLLFPSGEPADRELESIDVDELGAEEL